MAVLLCLLGALAHADELPDNDFSMLSGSAPPATPRAPPMDQAIRSLEARLQREPGDVEGWVLLGRSYHFMQRFDEAKVAFDKARALGYTQPIPELAPAAAGAAPTPRAQDRPVPPQAQAAAMPSGLMQDIAATLEKAKAGQATPPAATASETASVPAASMIDVRISLDPKAGALAPDTAVFVFARDASGTSRMPVAVARRTVRDLPCTVTLGESDAMTPAASLAATPAIIVGARIALSGSPVAAPGDIESLSPPLRDWHGTRVDLTLGARP